MDATLRHLVRNAACAGAALLLALGGSACAERAAEGPAGTAPAPAAAPASALSPALSVETLDHGRFELSAQRGSWVVVNFWATWCAPCLKEIPDLSAFDAARDDVRVIGLAYEEITPEDMRAFLAQHPAGYPVALVDVYAPPAGFDTPRGLPTTHLVAPDGSLAKTFVGPVTSADLSRAIAEAGKGAGPDQH